MAEILVGMAGSLIVFAGVAIGYGIGVHSAKKAHPKVIAEKESEQETEKIPVSQQFENLMRYDGRGDQ